VVAAIVTVTGATAAQSPDPEPEPDPDPAALTPVVTGYTVTNLVCVEVLRIVVVGSVPSPDWSPVDDAPSS